MQSIFHFFIFCLHLTFVFHYKTIQFTLKFFVKICTGSHGLLLRASKWARTMHAIPT